MKMKSFLVLSALVAVCRGQGYNYNAPASGGIAGLSSSFSSGISSGIGSGISSGYTGGISSGGSNSISSNAGFNTGSTGFRETSSFSSGGLYNSNAQMINYASQAPIVHKHVYVHVAPEEPEERIARPPPVSGPPTKHYKIIFVKTPSPPSYVNPVVPLQPQHEEKTLVYVLVKKPEEQPDVVLPSAAPTQPSKPEVYFIKYKTQKQAVSSGAGNVVSGGIGGGISSGIGGGISSGIGGGISSGIGGGISSGISSGIGGIGGGISSGISGGSTGSGVDSGSSNVADFARVAPAPKYGPPGYQN